MSSLLLPAFSFCCSAIDDSITSAKESRATGGEREEVNARRGRIREIKRLRLAGN